MGNLSVDLRATLRAFWKSPGFTLLGVCTLAIGIGANSAIFSVINAVLLRPLPFEAPDGLVRVTSDFEGAGVQDAGLAPLELFDLRDDLDVFEAVSGVYPIDANLTGGDEPERVEALLVDVAYFDVLGVSARLGRTFRADDYRPGIAEAVVISDGLWRRRFGADPDVVGRQVRLDEDLFTVVGVMPPGFWHPGQTLRTGVELWAPSGWSAEPFGPPNRQDRFLQGVIARLRPGVTIETAAAAVAAYGSRVRETYASDYPERVQWRPRVIGLREDLVGESRRSLLLLFGAVGLVLLLACSSVANLQLARATTRGREFAIRSALGAARPRLLGQILAESIAFSLAGGLAGIVLALWATSFLSSLGAIRSTTHTAVTVDRAVLAFTLLVSMVSGVLAGLAPAVRSSNPDIRSMLQGVVRAEGWGRGQGRLRSGMVVAQYALAVILLVAAALMVRTFRNLQNVPLGFEPDGVLTAAIWLPQPNDRSTGPYFTPESRQRFYRGVLAGVAEIGGVQSVALTTRLPMGGLPRTSFTIEGDASEAEPPIARISVVSPAYFTTLGIPVVSGQTFAPEPPADPAVAPLEVVVNRQFAERYLGDRDPIGEQIRFGGANAQGPWFRVVGVVDDVPTDALDSPVEPQIYASIFTQGPASLNLVVRAGPAAAQLADAVRDAVQQVDPDMPLFGVTTLDRMIADSTAQRRTAMVLFAIFAIVALTIATVGVYGVVAYSVAQRIPEIGLRIALGADRWNVLRLVLGQGAAIMGTGIGIGLVAAFGLSRLLEFLLFGVTPTDATSMVAVTAVLLAAGLTACSLPGWRAARLDPGEALMKS